MSRAPFLDGALHRLSLEIAEFAKVEIAARPPASDDDGARREARILLQILGKGGWLRHTVPAEFGGESERLSLRALALVREALAYASPLADVVFALQGLGSMPIALSGNRAMQERWLPLVAQGAAMAAFAMSEPEAGSDVSAIQTRALKVGDDYVLDGRKWFISNAGIADFYSVFATTDPALGR
ncbi:MAG: acyl-CoA dehydrogenase family protein, partial [Myxococcota bacterium]